VKVGSNEGGGADEAALRARLNDVALRVRDAFIRHIGAINET
jgi:hypothetical protein